MNVLISPLTRCKMICHSYIRIWVKLCQALYSGICWHEDTGYVLNTILFKTSSDVAIIKDDIIEAAFEGASWELGRQYGKREDKKQERKYKVNRIHKFTKKLFLRKISFNIIIDLHCPTNPFVSWITSSVFHVWFALCPSASDRPRCPYSSQTARPCIATFIRTITTIFGKNWRLAIAEPGSLSGVSSTIWNIRASLVTCTPML
jgi:hypothetical protein